MEVAGGDGLGEWNEVAWGRGGQDWMVLQLAWVVSSG